MNREKEGGFTLVEVVFAVAILSFAIFATLRVITASLNSITRQGQRVKALHLVQAQLTELEAKSFCRIVPEIWTIDSGATYRLGIYDPGVSPTETLVSSDDDYWYDDDGLGFSPNDDNDDGILVVSGDGTTVYTCINPSANETEGPGTPVTADYNWNTDDSDLLFDDADLGKEIQIYYRYYHLIKEGGTISLSDGEGLRERTIKLITSVGNTDGIGTAEEKSDIMGDDLTSGAPLSSSDYDSFNSQTKELTFIEDKEGNSVFIYYLPKDTGTDGDGDGYKDPLDDAILGVVKGGFYNPDGTLTNQITNSKKVTVTEYWKQGENIQSMSQETYINR